MRKTQFFCDRCGKLIEDTAHVLAVKYYNAQGEDFDWDEGAELCKDCYNVVDKAIADLIKPPKQKKKAGGYGKLDLDLGKIAALHNAGWSSIKIGDELGVSDTTIRNHLQEALDFLAKQKEEENE